MNKQTFLNFILSPEKISEKNVAELATLVKDFPYCQATQMLYAKSLHISNSIHYDNQLKIAAAYTTNREKLYFLINELKPKLSVPIVEKPKKVEEKKAIEVPIPEKVVTKPVVSTQKQVEKAAPVEPKTQEDTIKQRLAEIQSKKVEKTQQTAIVQPKTPKPAPEIKPSITETPKESVLAKDKEILKQLTDIGKLGSATAKSSESKLKQADEKRFKQDIIDTFIKEQPSISRPKQEFFSPENLANKSIQDKNEIVSETLANIYEQQGAIDKALAAYDRLSLIFPEKSSYFASRIKEIKNKNNIKE